MADEVRPYFDMDPEEVYAAFLNALAGLEDDAGIENYSPEGIAHLDAALKAFRMEYQTRHGREAT